MFVEAYELHMDGANLFKGYAANSQIVYNGIVTLSKTPDTSSTEEPTPAPSPAPSAAPAAISIADAKESLIKGIARYASLQNRHLGSRAKAWLSAGPQSLRAFKRPFLRKYAALDGSAREATRIIEAALKVPGLLNKIDRNGAFRQALKMDAPVRGPAQRYGSLTNVQRLAPSTKITPSLPATKVISFRNMSRLALKRGARNILPPEIAAPLELLSMVEQAVMPTPSFRRPLSQHAMSGGPG